MTFNFISIVNKNPHASSKPTENARKESKIFPRDFHIKQQPI